MRYDRTSIDGLLVATTEPAVDERGSFTRWFDADELAGLGHRPVITTMAASANVRRHTLRGLHYQRGASGEWKLIRCTGGRIFDVIVDAREASDTFGAVATFELAAEDGTALVVPEGCAHGFLTLADDSELTYLLSGRYDPAAATGIRWDDPGLDVPWPAPPAVISDRDLALPFGAW